MPSKPIDLGKTYPKIEQAAKPMDAKKVNYPTLHISDVDGLDGLPDGDFTFTGVGNVVVRTETTRNGEDYCSYEIEIKSIKPMESGKTKKGLDEALDEIADEKSKTIEAETDEGEGDEEE